jgi:hypothetical protein
MPIADGKNIINSLAGVEAMWIMRDGTVYYSRDFKYYVDK